MYITVPAEEVRRRLDALSSLLRENDVDWALLIYGPDLFYFTGIVQQGALFVPADGEPVYFVRRFYERARNESPGFLRVEKIDSFIDVKKFLGDFLKTGLRLGLEKDVLPAALHEKLVELFSPRETVDVSHLVRLVKSVKSPWEREMMRESGRKLVEMVRKAGEFIREGETEVSVLGLMVEYALRSGHEGFIKMRNWNQTLPFGHVLAGPAGGEGTYTDTPLGGRGTYPGFPVGPGRQLIERGVPVVVDVMWVHGGYTTDMTRVYSMGEVKDPLLQKAHSVSVEILRRVEEDLRPGKGTREVFRAARAMAEKEGLGEYFMGPPGNRMEFLGHGIGTEVDEYPFLVEKLDFVLQEGMTVAVEPKFVFPGKGAVGVENTYIITSRGPENLTVLEEEIIVLEA